MARQRRAKPKEPPKAAFSVRYYEITDWPEIPSGSELLVPRNTQLPLDPAAGGPPHTRFRPAEIWRVTDFQKLDVEHERRKRGYNSPFYRQNWRIEEKVWNEITERYTFTAYLPASRDAIYMRASALVADGALRRVRENLPTFSFTQRNVDVLQFIDCLKAHVAKAWWKQMRLEHVSSASLAGISVEQGPDYARFNDEGSMAAATLNIRWQNHVYQVMVTSLNTIFFFLSDEERAAHLAAYVNQLLVDCPGVTSSSQVPPPSDDEDDQNDEPDTSAGHDVTLELL